MTRNSLSLSHSRSLACVHDRTTWVVMGQSSEPSHHYHRPRTNRQDVGRLRPTRRVGTAIGNLMIIISYLSTASLCAIFIPPFAPPLRLNIKFRMCIPKFPHDEKKPSCCHPARPSARHHHHQQHGIARHVAFSSVWGERPTKNIITAWRVLKVDHFPAIYVERESYIWCSQTGRQARRLLLCSQPGHNIRAGVEWSVVGICITSRSERRGTFISF